MGDISKVEVDGTLYNIKDAVARKQVEQMETELPSKVESEVESYLSENPPQGGSISQSDIVSALAVYFRDNPVKDGEDGVSPTVEVSEIEGGHRITITDATTTEPKVIDVLDGVKGDKGDAGVGIENIEKTSTEGLVDTYTITFTDSSTTTFTVTNGKDGSEGSGTVTDEQIASAVSAYLEENPVSGGLTEQQVNAIVEKYIQDNNISGGVSTEKIAQAVENYIAEHPITGVTQEDVQNAVNSYLAEHPVSDGQDGSDGVGIASVDKTSTNGLVDTYTITFTDGNTTTFTVTNGKDGESGSGTVTEEQIASAVQMYLTEHPIEGGMTTEQLNTAISNYMVANPVTNVDEDTFDNMADEWIENIKIAGANLPIIFLEGDMTGISKENAVPMKMRFVSQFKSFEETCTLKYQGTSSLNYPKKNFTMKLDNKHGVGWGNQKKYCLKANYIDHSHARNIVSARLWSQVVASRPDYAEMPELLKDSPNNGAVDGFPIRVYLNEAYQGLYTMNIPKGSWQFKMDDTNENHCILCGENYVSGCFRGSALIDGTDWSDELHDVVPDRVKTRWNEVIDFVMNSTDEDFKANITNYIDLQSLIDYYIFAYVSTGLDSMGKNQIYYTYDGQKYYASMYDMDSTWGMYWSGQRFVSSDYRMQEEYESMSQGRAGNLLYARLKNLFKNEIELRYNELRSSVLSFSNILGEFERFMSCITTEQYSEDLTIYTGIPSGTTNNISQLRNYIAKRLNYVDGQINTIYISSLSVTGINSVKVSSTRQLNYSLEPTNANTYNLEWSSSNTEVATVDNTGLVTPVSIGETTITLHDTISDVSCEFSLSVIEDTQDIEGTAYYGSKVTDYAVTTDIGLPYKNFMVFGPTWNNNQRTIICFDDPIFKIKGNNTLSYADSSNKPNAPRMSRNYEDGSTVLDKSKIIGYYWDISSNQWVEFDVFNVPEGVTVWQSVNVVNDFSWWTANTATCLYFSNFDIKNEGDFVLKANYNQSDYE